MDRFGWSRKKAVIIFTIVELAGGMLCCFFPDFYNLVSTYAGDYFYCLSSLISVLVFAWIYGIKKIREHTNTISDVQVGGYLDALLKYLTFALLFIVVAEMFI